MNFNFVSIPRCASQSIHNAFRTQKYMNHKAIGLFPNQSLFSFAVIRDPADRIRSWWAWHKNHKQFQEWYLESFEEWCQRGFKTHWTPDKCKEMGITNALKQKDYVTINGEIKVDMLIPYPKLKEKIKKVASIVGVKQHNLLQIGVSRKIPIEPKITKLIMDNFKEDYELYEGIK